MKNQPLALQIWLISVAVTSLVFVMLIFFLPWTLRDFFTRQVFDMLKDSQPGVGIVTMQTASSPSDPSLGFALPAQETQATDEARYAVIGITSDATVADPAYNTSSAPEESAVPSSYSSPAIPSPGDTGLFPPADTADPSLAADNPAGQLTSGCLTISVSDGSLAENQYTFSMIPFSSSVDLPAVHHLVLGGQYGDFLPENLPDDFLVQIKEDAKSQEEDYGEYQKNIDDQVLLYVIRKTSIDGQSIYAVSYAWSTYLESLVSRLNGQLGLMMGIMAVLGFGPSLLLARRLSRPLRQMEAQAQRIAMHDWNEPINIDRRDEIGSLAMAMENMRQRLRQQDEAERFMLQSISHELKTPVMVIRSYAQSMLDGVYPRGNSDSSVAVIIEESERLEKRVRDLLYLNKLNYLQSCARSPGADQPAAPEACTEVFEIDALFNACVERFCGLRPELSWDVNLEPQNVLGCLEQWKVGIENLLDNQQRYAASRVSISPIPQETPGFLVIRIWNDGSELNSDQMGTLFQPFSSGPGGEFGLGLIILHRVAQLNGGKVWAANESGGVAFYLQIPEPPGA